MKKHILLSFLIIVSLINNKQVFSQFNSTTYYMQNLPQASQLNPAFQPNCNFYLTVVGLSVDFGNSSLNFDNLVTYLPEEDLFILPFDTLATPEIQDKFLNSLKPVNSFMNYSNVNVGFGFRAGDNYFSFNVAERIEINMDYPDDFVNFLIKGNASQATYDWSGFGGRARAYEEVSLGYSRKINTSLSIGFRGKILFGQADLSMSKQDIYVDVDTTDVTITVDSQFDLNGAGAFFDVQTKDGDLSKFGIADFDYLDMATGFKNLGFAIDFGIDYKVTDKFAISGSVLDLGIINWKDNAFNLSNNSNFVFNGTEVDFPLGNNNDSTRFFDVLKDSLMNSFDINTSLNKPYTSMLTGKVLFGLNYSLTKRIDLGLLAYTKIYRSTFYPRVTASLNLRPFKMINTSFS